MSAKKAKRFIRNTFFKNLETGTVKLPDGPDGKLIDVPIADLGIKYPVVVTHPKIQTVTYYPKRAILRLRRSGKRGGPEGDPALGRAVVARTATSQNKFKLRKYRFCDSVLLAAPAARPAARKDGSRRRRPQPSTAASGGEATTTSS